MEIHSCEVSVALGNSYIGHAVFKKESRISSFMSREIIRSWFINIPQDTFVLPVYLETHSLLSFFHPDFSSTLPFRVFVEGVTWSLEHSVQSGLVLNAAIALKGWSAAFSLSHLSIDAGFRVDPVEVQWWDDRLGGSVQVSSWLYRTCWSWRFIILLVR